MNGDRPIPAATRAPAATTPPMFEGRPLPNPDEPPYDQGLHFDVETLLDRRRVLKLLAFGGIGAAIVACAPAAATFLPTTTPTGTTAATTAADECSTVIPEETAGPYPGDGSNGPDVLSQSGIVRKDITTSFGDHSGTATGVPLTIRFAIQDLANGCAPLAGAAVYVWHCDQAGDYSLYTNRNQNYLRGVQAAGDDGIVEFTSVFPACYSGRWPHIHFEVYRSLDAATDSANRIATSQIALPEDICAAVYATTGYEQSVRNLSQVSLERDNVFGDDGGVHELGAMSGTIENGLGVELAVPVRA